MTKFCCVCYRNIIEDYENVCDECFRKHYQEEVHKKLRHILEDEEGINT